jgi:phosphate acyltransferase
LRIGVDLLGSDTPSATLWEAARQAADEFGEGAALVLIGRKPEGSLGQGLEFLQVSEEITMEDPPLQAVRQKRGASLLVGMHLVRSGGLDALVSAGNTGAIIASAALHLGLLQGVSRPALLATLPTLSGSVAVVDIGGNVVVRPRHLVEFARMGVAYQRCKAGLAHPRVGLLNIGTESKKGTTGIQEAYELLRKAADGFQFVGNIEGREAFTGVVDVLVSDGFSGNVFLKTAEGIAAFIFTSLEEAFKDLLGPEARERLMQLNRRVNYAEYPGAIVCGVRGVVIKCHGLSSALALLNGIRGAHQLVREQFVGKVAALLAQEGS